MTTHLAADPDLLRLNFDSTAEWRRQCAIRFPNDDRCLEAVEILERLAGTVDDVDAAFLDAYTDLCDDCDDSSKQQEMLRAVGFHYFPADATEFVKDFIASRTGG